MWPSPPRLPHPPDARTSEIRADKNTASKRRGNMLKVLKNLIARKDDRERQHRPIHAVSVRACALSSEYGTYTTVNARFWPRVSGKSQKKILSGFSSEAVVARNVAVTTAPAPPQKALRIPHDLKQTSSRKCSMRLGGSSLLSHLTITMLSASACALSSEHGTDQTAKARLWPSGLGQKSTGAQRRGRGTREEAHERVMTGKYRE